MEFKIRRSPPINFIHVNDDHYVALLLKTQDEINDETYYYFTGFTSDEENQAFRNREPQNIPANEILFAGSLGPIFRIDSENEIFLHHIFFTIIRNVSLIAFFILRI